jgi:DNA ligase (NAD+)
MKNIKELMQRASDAYEKGTPFLSDEEYDALERQYGAIMPSAGEIPHYHRMYSLKKHYPEDGPIPLEGEVFVSPKLDGAAVSLLYINGNLELGLTRGNGKAGRDITEKLSYLVPTTIDLAGTIQITGEVVAHKDIPNSRNYASGALNQKEITSFKQRAEEGSIIFVAYNITPSMNDTYEHDLGTLNILGFNSVQQNWDDYPTDGIVYRINDNKAFQALGYTEKFPRGAIAYKEQKEAVETTLLDVVWQTGKSGKVTPVAILETVDIGGANVSRATLNNIAYIEALNLEIGCKVRVVRSGEIIPKIIARAD